MRFTVLILVGFAGCGRPVGSTSVPPPASASAVAPATASVAAQPARRTPEQALAALLDGRPPSEVPVVRLEGERVSIDGAPSGRVAPDQAGRIEEVYAALRATREGWKRAHAEKPFPGLVVLRSSVATTVPSWKRLFSTAVASGFPNVVVLFDEHLDRPFPIEPTIPGAPPGAMEPAIGIVHVQASGVTVAWNGEAPRAAIAAELGAGLCRGWKTHGRHRRADDRRFDLLELQLAGDASLASLLPLGDAMESCRRTTAVGDEQAFFVRLAP